MKVYKMSGCKHEVKTKPKQDKTTKICLRICPLCSNGNFRYRGLKKE